jgi:hypothetical protein
MDKRIERSNHGKILRRVAKHLALLGFRNSKSAFFIRQQSWVVEFIHLHKYSFESAYRIHLAIRVLNDNFPAAALNGPDSHAYTCADSPNGSKYTFVFRPDQASVDSCSEEIQRWCSEVGVTWFNQFRDPLALLTRHDSPLDENGKVRLRLAMAGRAEPDAVEKSYSLFGVINDV